MRSGYITIHTVNEHEQYIGRQAILCEANLSSFVQIIKTSRCAATVKHKNGSLQKCLWGNLSIINS